MAGLTAMAHPGVSLVMDSKDNIYYSDLQQVWRIDTQDKKSVVVRDVHTLELYIDGHDNLYTSG